MRWRPPAIDQLRAAIMGVSATTIPMLNAINVTNLDNGQQLAIQSCITAVVVLAMLFYPASN